MQLISLNEFFSALKFVIDMSKYQFSRLFLLSLIQKSFMKNFIIVIFFD